MWVRYFIKGLRYLFIYFLSVSQSGGSNTPSQNGAAAPLRLGGGEELSPCPDPSAAGRGRGLERRTALNGLEL